MVELPQERIPAALAPNSAPDPTAACRGIPPGLVRTLVRTEQLGVGPAEYRGSIDEPYLGDEFAAPVALAARSNPFSVGCFDGALSGGAVLAAASNDGPVSGLIRHAAAALGDPAHVSTGAERGDFHAAIAAICARFSPEGEASGACGPATGVLPDGLGAALAPLMWALHDGVVVRLEGDEALEVRTADWWRDHGGKGLLPSNDQEGYNTGFEEDRAYLSSPRGRLYGAAAAIGAAVHAANLASFRGLDAQFELVTPAGLILVSGAGDDRHEADGRPVLLLLDLGGADLHLGPAGSNHGGSNPVSVLVDLGGDDFYGYPEAVGVGFERARPPLDRDGTVTLSGKVNGASASEASAQGAGRNGIAMVFDLGAGEDRYVALRMSQGYAQQGVGVLFDDGGDDIYFAEDAAQGSAQFGIGLLVDMGGQDVYLSSHASQGFGYVGGFGLLFDAGGDDRYRCHPDHDGNPAYVAPQLPGEANASLCQGFGLGFRVRDETHSLAGGIGVIVDGGGDDRYEAGVYGQGGGYWQGFGLLSDRGGNDHYDGRYYVQGAAAHFGAGFFVEHGGDDRYGHGLGAETMVLGAAQDYSVGVVLEMGGDDAYRVAPMGAGAASCGSVAAFVDGGGVDRYEARSGTVGGVASARGCRSEGLPTTAVFLDVGGEDHYDIPGPHRNEHTWEEGEEKSPGETAFAADFADGDHGLDPRR